MDSNMSYSIPTEMSLEERRLFFNNYKEWCDFFGKEEVDEQLLRVPIDKLVEIEKVIIRVDGQHRNKNFKPYWRHYVELGTAWTYTHIPHPQHQDYTRVGQALCRFFLIPNRYQGLAHERMIEPLLLARFPFLEKYRLSIYDLRFYPNHDDEFYVGLSKEYSGHKSLYVPYNALVKGDVLSVIKRNKEYLRWYTKSPDVWNAMQDDPVVVDFLADLQNHTHQKYAKEKEHNDHELRV